MYLLCRCREGWLRDSHCGLLAGTEYRANRRDQIVVCNVVPGAAVVYEWEEKSEGAGPASSSRYSIRQSQLTGPITVKTDGCYFSGGRRGAESIRIQLYLQSKLIEVNNSSHLGRSYLQRLRAQAGLSDGHRRSIRRMCHVVIVMALQLIARKDPCISPKVR